VVVEDDGVAAVDGVAVASRVAEPVVGDDERRALILAFAPML
jgi:hypothetical protein